MKKGIIIAKISLQVLEANSNKCPNKDNHIVDSEFVLAYRIFLMHTKIIKSYFLHNYVF